MLAKSPLSPIIRELAAIRKEKSITRQDLAIDMGMVARQQYIYKWETGHHSPSLANLERWCAALGYELDLHVKETSDE